MQKKFDLSIYFVADPACCAGRPIGDVVMAAIKGGVTMVQYRNKSGNMAQIAGEAAYLSEIMSNTGIPLLINDHIDVAVSASADGVHLGQGDADPKIAREKMGRDAIIGQTAFLQKHIMAVDSNVVDYIGTGPFYSTKTDKGKPILGAEAFSKLASLSPVPVVGVGGITPENGAEVLGAGAKGLAMMRSISEAEDVEAAARAFVNLF